jgi:hypothetical protein
MFDRRLLEFFGVLSRDCPDLEILGRIEFVWYEICPMIWVPSPAPRETRKLIIEQTRQEMKSR